MSRVSYTKELVRQHGFQRMDRSRDTETYRRRNQFLVRMTVIRGGAPDPDCWTARRGPSSRCPDWLGPVFKDPMACLIAAELDNWGQ